MEVLLWTELGFFGFDPGSRNPVGWGHHSDVLHSVVDAVQPLQLSLMLFYVSARMNFNSGKIWPGFYQISSVNFAPGGCWFSRGEDSLTSAKQTAAGRVPNRKNPPPPHINHGEKFRVLVSGILFGGRCVSWIMYRCCFRVERSTRNKDANRYQWWHRQLAPPPHAPDNVHFNATIEHEDLVHAAKGMAPVPA